MKKTNRRIAALASLLLSSTSALAQLAPAAGSSQATLSAAGNKTPIVNIVAPNAAGVSHNRFTDYNVGAQGLILNNSAAGVSTKLGGDIAGNPALRGGAAKVILNEVIGSKASLLGGATEIAGQRARLVLVNPNGISVKGASFVNVSRATLTTGKPVFDASGNITRIDTAKGKIDGQGLDASTVDQVDLIAYAVEVSGLQSKRQASIVTGAANTDIDLSKSTSNSVSSTIVLDASNLGGMYSSGISLVGNGQGVGVNVGGTAKALTGSLEVSPQGGVTHGPSAAKPERMDVAKLRAEMVQERARQETEKERAKQQAEKQAAIDRAQRLATATAQLRADVENPEQAAQRRAQQQAAEAAMLARGRQEAREAAQKKDEQALQARSREDDARRQEQTAAFERSRQLAATQAQEEQQKPKTAQEEARSKQEQRARVHTAARLTGEDVVNFNDGFTALSYSPSSGMLSFSNGTHSTLMSAGKFGEGSNHGKFIVLNPRSSSRDPSLHGLDLIINGSPLAVPGMAWWVNSGTPPNSLN